MNTQRIVFASLVVVLALVTSDLFARGGGGGRSGGGGGGGGARGGGGGYSGGARPASPAFNNSPSMSRVSPSQGISRPAQTPSGNRPAIAGSGAGPALGGGQGALGNRPAQLPAGSGIGSPATAGRAALQSPQSFQRPSQGQVSDFLSLPQQAPAGVRNASPPTAGQLPSTGSGIQSKTVTTPGGSTISIAGGGGSRTTQGGATVGAAGGAIKIEGAGGNTVVKGGGVAGASKGDNAVVAGGSRGGIQTAGGAEAGRASGFRAATDGTNSAIRAGSVSGARDAAGNAIGNVRGGYADSSGSRRGGSLTAARNQWGYTAAGAIGGVAVGGAARVGGVAGIRGPGGTVVAAGRGAAFVNGQFIGGRAWTAVNGAYARWGVFTPGWYGRYPGAWWPGKWAVAATAWSAAMWTTAGSYCGCSGEGAYYDYGGNVIYEGDTVYYGEQPVATAEQYYQQAGQIADAGAGPQDQDWLPLGVFAVIAEPTQTQTDKVVQLAVNREGVVRGNLQDFLTDKVIPVVGAVDRNTQRVAIKLDGITGLIVETGLYNLTNDEVPVLLHFGPERQEARTLIRLQQPTAQEQPQ